MSLVSMRHALGMTRKGNIWDQRVTTEDIVKYLEADISRPRCRDLRSSSNPARQPQVKPRSPVAQRTGNMKPNTEMLEKTLLPWPSLPNLLERKNRVESCKPQAVNSVTDEAKVTDKSFQRYTNMVDVNAKFGHSDAKIDAKRGSPIRMSRSNSLPTVAAPARPSTSPAQFGKTQSEPVRPESPPGQFGKSQSEPCKALTKPKKVRRLTNIFDEMCAKELLHSHSLDLDKLRLYFKGSKLQPGQINLKHAETHWTFLHHFALQGDLDLVKWGLDAGAESTAKNAMGKTPLHLAVENKQLGAAIALLKAGADPNAKTLSGYTCLHLAVLNGSSDLVCALFEHSKKPLDVYEDSAHGTALDLARDPAIREALEQYSPEK
eukprot:gnl/MRDRNA2_/MRDRNA2_92905_c0_seq1.p1 gnl/MRDRNA2_/MRDRNA2_92905_c0~~gnl/MRDRNA2_/MRDRNA2_92905_c0_seq1.p1  ORF type:complete len:377 (+),score=62.51 gnl/MRDRNA2_/MRDRNA2_92905_c0_seq1:86-1216(+)